MGDLTRVMKTKERKRFWWLLMILPAFLCSGQELDTGVNLGPSSLLVQEDSGGEQYELLSKPDFNDDCRVDLDDFFPLADHFGSACGETNWNPVFDMNEDCIIDTTDSGYFLDAYHLTWSKDEFLAVLQTAPEIANIGDVSYALEAYLWRDFMPVSPPDGKSMIVLVRAIELDSEEFASDIEACCLWVINGHDIWTTRFSDEGRPLRPPNELEKVARDGPKWGPGIWVDVVVGLRDGEGNLYLVRQSNQLIDRTS